MNHQTLQPVATTPPSPRLRGEESGVRGTPFRNLLFFLLTLLLLPLAGCPRVVRETQPGNAPDPGASIPTVTVERPKYKAIQRVIEQPAFVEAYEETPLIAGIPGFVGKVHADIAQVFDKD